MAKHRSLKSSDLSPDQAKVYTAVSKWAKEPKGLLTLGGYAGTGKTSILGVFAATTPLLVAYVCFTGRASSVLKRKLEACGVELTDKTRATTLTSDPRFTDSSLPRKGGPAFVGTLHRLLYAPVVNSKTDELIGWRKRDELDRKYDLIVVDEASMVGDEMLTDLQIHGVPILAVGDHGQLPPVMDSGKLMQKPMLKLEKIHRQAESNPIIQLSKEIRETGKIVRHLEDGEHIEFVKASRIESAIGNACLDVAEGNVASLLDNVALCYMNKTRIKLNQFFRTACNVKGVPRKGEIVICLKNAPPIYNGMRGVLVENGAMDEEKPWLLRAPLDFPDEEIASVDVAMCGATFNRERPFENLEEMQKRLPVRKMSEGGAPYDFGYALTVHRAQGSQFPSVIFYVDRSADPNSDEWRRFAYTAATRASNKLTVVT